MSASRPTPWKFINGYLLDANGDRVFEVPFFRADPGAKERETFLIQAVNSRDTLVEALEGLMLQIERFDPGGCIEGRKISGKNVDRLREARAALALAGKKQTLDPGRSLIEARIHHDRHGDMDGKTCLLSACALHYPKKRKR